MWNNHLTLPKYIDLLDKWGQVTNVAGSHHNQHHHNQHHHQRYQHRCHTLHYKIEKLRSRYLFLHYHQNLASSHHHSNRRNKYIIQLWTDSTDLQEPTIRYSTTGGKSKHCKNCKCSLLSQLQLNIILFRNDAVFYRFFQNDVNINPSQGGDRRQGSTNWKTVK